MGRSQISIEVAFFALAAGIFLLFFLQLATRVAEGSSGDFSAFRSYGTSVIGGDGLLFNPEEGAVGRSADGHVADHLLLQLPENVTAIGIPGGEALQEGTDSGFCSWRAASYRGRTVLLSVCSG